MFMEKNVKEKNSNYHRIERLIVNAFINLSSQKHYSQISVTELCDTAGINRTTFYKHYRGTWEIKDHISKDIVDSFERLHNEFKGKTFADNSSELFAGINKELKLKDDYYHSIFRMKGSAAFVEVIVRTMREQMKREEGVFIRNEKLANITFSYIIGGILNTYRAWFNGELNCDLDDLANILTLFVDSYKKTNIVDLVK